MSQPASAPPSPTPRPDASCPLCGHATPAADLHDRAARLIARQEEVLHKLEKPQRKSWWERTPVVVAVVGLIFTISYQGSEAVNRRAEQRRAEEVQRLERIRVRDAQRLEMMSKFFPYLISADTTAQRRAIVAMNRLADTTLAAAAAEVAPSLAATNALREVRLNPISIDDTGYVASVIRHPPAMEPVIRPGGTAPPAGPVDSTAVAP